jgi:hypothetical protein
MQLQKLAYRSSLVKTAFKRAVITIFNRITDNSAETKNEIFTTDSFSKERFEFNKTHPIVLYMD